MDASRLRDVNGHMLALIGALLLVLLTGTLLAALRNAWHTTHPVMMRNHHFARGWLDHAGRARPSGTNETLVILIGNSQGFGSEVSDTQTYAQLLQTHVTRQWGQTRVLNWSLPGATGQEFVILAAQAQRLNPDVLVLVTGPGNFDASLGEFDTRRKKPAPWWTDVYRLLGDPKVRDRLPRSFLSQYFSPADYLDIGLCRLSRLWSHRHVPVSWFARFRTFQRFEPSWQREAILYPARMTGFPLRAAKTAPVENDVHQVSRTLLNHYFEVADKVAGRRYFLVMPIHSQRRREISESISELRRSADRANHEFMNFSAAVPDELFMDMTHLDKQGHATFARSIAARLPESLPVPGAP
jgi:hypothetical protein